MFVCGKGFGFKEPSGSKGGNWKAVKMQRWAVTGHTQGYASIHMGIQGYTSRYKRAVTGYKEVPT